MDYYFQQWALGAIDFVFKVPQLIINKANRTIDILTSPHEDTLTYAYAHTGIPIHDIFGTGDYTSHIKIDYRTVRHDLRVWQYKWHRSLLDLEKFMKKFSEEVNVIAARQRKDIPFKEPKRSERPQVIREMWAFGLLGAAIGGWSVSYAERFVYPVLKPVRNALFIFLPAFYGVVFASFYVKNKDIIRPLMVRFGLLSESALSSEDEEEEEEEEEEKEQKPTTEERVTSLLKRVIGKPAPPIEPEENSTKVEETPTKA
eukprot:TRINITY_DN5157_c0_g1_i2.p1 TRINITY_DN5157_c0_g1~~TRINITY_DN5157_c0_g1_i2.p1  ORF type:complete len:299 (-),score=65.38 TRINITY_DN5157_c0_g1_i2:176-949(-)